MQMTLDLPTEIVDQSVVKAEQEAPKVCHRNQTKNATLEENSGYAQDLFERVIEHTDDALHRIEIVLRWRGFLVQRQGERLLLSQGSTPQDRAALRVHHIPVIEFTPQQGFNSEIVNPTEISVDRLQAIFQMRNRHRGLSGPFDFNGVVNPSWKSFTQLRYGAKVPVEFLDHGIALLVKVLPLLGLQTAMSCDGHLTKPPMIYFFSQYHLQWAKVALPQCVPLDNPLFSSWQFVAEDNNWLRCIWSWAESGCGSDLEARWLCYSNIQHLCANIMDSDIAEKARRCKQNLKSPDDLQNPEKTRF